MMVVAWGLNTGSPARCGSKLWLGQRQRLHQRQNVGHSRAAAGLAAYAMAAKRGRKTCT